MLRETQRKSSAKRIRYPGIMKAAEKLGVHRNHLYLVLRGDRISHSLRRRYNELNQEASNEPAS